MFLLHSECIQKHSPSWHKWCCVTPSILVQLVLCACFHPCHAIAAASHCTETLSKKLLWTAQQKNRFIIFTNASSTWCMIPSPRAPSDFHIEKKALPWFDLPRARGAVFYSSCPSQRPPCPGMGKDLALESYLGLKLEGGFIRESPYTIMSSVKCCFSQSHPPLCGPWPFPRWSEGWLPMGSPYFRLALQAEKSSKFPFVFSVLFLL